MKVYRVENDNFVGPFQDGSNIDNYIWNQWRWDYIGDRHPSPWFDDLEDYLYKGYVFACPSLHMLCHWFAPVMDILEDMGYKVVEYTVEDAHWGKSLTQVIFKHDVVTNSRVISKQEYLEYRKRYYGEF